MSLKLEEFKRQHALISRQAEEQIGQSGKFTDELAGMAETARNSASIWEEVESQFEECTGLNKLDVSILFLAAALQVVRQYFFTKFPKRLDDQTSAKGTWGHNEEHSNRQHRYYNPSLEEILTNPVPFDANRGANGALKGGGRLGHRATAIGHDPILGLVVGTANIATSTLTNKDLQSYHICTNSGRDFFGNKAQTPMVFAQTGDKLLHRGLEGKKIVGASLLKEIIHLRSDLHTKHSLPFPVISVIDASKASELAERGLDMSNIVTVGKQAAFSALINTLIAMFHGLFYDESQHVNRRVYEVKTRKILSYSNIIASTSNLIYVGGSALLGNESALKSLDVGGLIVTVYRFISDKKFIRQVKREFIEQEFLGRIDAARYNDIF